MLLDPMPSPMVTAVAEDVATALCRRWSHLHRRLHPMLHPFRYRRGLLAEQRHQFLAGPEEWAFDLMPAAAVDSVPSHIDAEEMELAAVDVEFHDYYGHDDREWEPWQRDQYLDAVERVQVRWHPERRPS